MIHAEKRHAAAQEYGVPVYPDHQSLLASGAVDAVVTTVPHYLRPEIGIAALKAGVRALVEKPAGVYTRQVTELNENAATHPELSFAIMFNQRNNPSVKVMSNGHPDRPSVHRAAAPSSIIVNRS